MKIKEIKAAGLPDKWKSWSVPTVNTSRWLEMLYNGLKPNERSSRKWHLRNLRTILILSSS